MSTYMLVMHPTQLLPAGATWSRTQPTAPATNDLDPDDSEVDVDLPDDESMMPKVHSHSGGWLHSHGMGSRSMDMSEDHLGRYSRHFEQQRRQQRRQDQPEASEPETEPESEPSLLQELLSLSSAPRPTLISPEMLAPPEPPPAPLEVLPECACEPVAEVPVDFESLAPGLGSLLERLVPEQPGTSGPERSRLGLLWTRYGQRLLTRCVEFGISSGTGSSSAYQAENRQVWVRAEEVPERALEVLARACDHALGDGTFASRTSLAVLSRCPQHLVSSPEDYFAQSAVLHILGQRTDLSDYLDLL